MTMSILVNLLQVWHAASLLHEFCVCSESLENICLPQRQLHGTLLILESNHKVFNLDALALQHASKA
jgi:hypothetical protein